MHDIRAFTLGDARYFLGVVALLNSLRITGNEMPLTVLDVGLEGWQRALLELHCEVRRGRSDLSAYLLKVDAPLESYADVVVVLDADLIVTRSLAPMVEAARQGRVVAYGDQLAERRWFAEWEELFGLRAPLRHEMYVNSGVVALSTRRLPAVLPRWAELCQVLTDRALMGASELGPDDPLWLADQEALNALLLSEVPEEQVERRVMPGMILETESLAGTKVDDVERLRCSWRGEPVTFLHAVGLVKPWQRRAAREYRRTAYATCLRRALSGPDLEVRVPPSRLPPWLRPGAAPAVTAQVLHLYDVVARTTRPARRRVGLSSGRAPVPAIDVGRPVS